MPRDCEYQRSRGERQKGRILAAIAAEPKTVRQLAEAVHLTMSAVLLHTKAMMRETPRRLHIAGYVPNSEGRPAPLYGPGDIPDASYERKRKDKVPDRLEARRAKLIELLRAAPRTAAQLGQLMHLSDSRVRIYIRELREEGGAYIKDWAPPPGRGDLSPVYALGNRPDKVKPRQTRADTYQKEISDPDKHARLLAKQRARYTVKKHTKRPQGVFAALGL